jgi:hypothetical protein
MLKNFDPQEGALQKLSDNGYLKMKLVEKK